MNDRSLADIVEVGDRVLVRDAEAEFDRTWEGTVTRIRWDRIMVVVKLDVGGRFEFPAEDIIAITC
jgi:hypothetical protein